MRAALTGWRALSTHIRVTAVTAPFLRLSENAGVHFARAALSPRISLGGGGEPCGRKLLERAPSCSSSFEWLLCSSLGAKLLPRAGLPDWLSSSSSAQPPFGASGRSLARLTESSRQSNFRGGARRLETSRKKLRPDYLLESWEASSECVCITRRMESRVTIPTICGASAVPLTTGIWLMSAVSSRSSRRSSGSSGEVH